MAIAHVANRGSGNAKAAGATLVVTATADIVVGEAVLVLAAWDSSDTTASETDRLSVSDESGNTWEKIEFQQSNGGSATGVIALLAWCTVETQIDSGDDIIVTSTDATDVAKAMVIEVFSLDSGNFLDLVDYEVAGGDDAAAGAQDITIAGLPGSTEYLFAHSYVYERGSTNTNTQGFTELGSANTTGGAANSNVDIAGGYLVQTATGDTAGYNNTATGDFAHILAAFKQTAAGGGTPQEIAAVGDTQTGGTARLSVPKYIVASADTLTGGAASLSVGRVLSALGDTLTGGVASLLTGKPLKASGDTLTGGSCRLQVGAPSSEKRFRRLLGFGK